MMMMLGGRDVDGRGLTEQGPRLQRLRRGPNPHLRRRRWPTNLALGDHRTEPETRRRRPPQNRKSSTASPLAVRDGAERRDVLPTRVRQRRRRVRRELLLTSESQSRELSRRVQTIGVNFLLVQTVQTRPRRGIKANEGKGRTPTNFGEKKIYAYGLHLPSVPFSQGRAQILEPLRSQRYHHHHHHHHRIFSTKQTFTTNSEHNQTARRSTKLAAYNYNTNVKLCTQNLKLNMCRVVQVVQLVQNMESSR